MRRVEVICVSYILSRVVRAPRRPTGVQLRVPTDLRSASAKSGAATPIRPPGSRAAPLSLPDDVSSRPYHRKSAGAPNGCASPAAAGRQRAAAVGCMRLLDRAATCSQPLGTSPQAESSRSARSPLSYHLGTPSRVAGNRRSAAYLDRECRRVPPLTIKNASRRNVPWNPLCEIL
jgi:hypothetical protein